MRQMVTVPFRVSAYSAFPCPVLATVDGVTTRYVGGYYEKIDGPSGSTVRTYYYHNGQRIAMRENGVTTWLLGDHLGSTSVTYRASDGETKSQRYEAWGLIRSGSANVLPTDYAFTGQRLHEQSGLMYYGARWYDPYLNRFIQPDTVVPNPGDPQSLNRFAYARNNPVRYRDPTGHWIETAFDIISLGMTINDIRNEGLTFWNAVSLATDVASLALPIVPAGASHAIRAGKLAAKAANAVDTAVDVVKVANAIDTATDAVKTADNVADATKLLSKADDATKVTVEGACNVLKSADKPPIIIGENMKRVKAYAEQVGGSVYRPWKNDPFDFDLAIRRNERWIKDQMRQGRKIIDIGPDFARRATGRVSDFYEMERRMLKQWDYQDYIKAFLRSGASGGVPGLDF